MRGGPRKLLVGVPLKLLALPELQVSTYGAVLTARSKVELEVALEALSTTGRVL